MSHSTTLFVGLDGYKDSISIAYVTAVRSPIATRNESTCRRSPDTELGDR
jgi:hypothetical protein